MKHKFSDFIVNEIDCDGRVAIISDPTLWKDFSDVKQSHKDYMQSEKKPKVNPFDAFVLSPQFHLESLPLLGEYATQSLISLIEQLKVNHHNPKFELKVKVPASKEDRVKIHNLIREHFPFMESLTRNQCNQKKQTKEQLKQDQVIAQQSDQPQIVNDEDHILIKIHNANYRKFCTTGLAKPEDKSLKKKYLKFMIMKRNVDSINVGILVSKFLGLSNKHFGIAGVKDKRGVTTQWATLMGLQTSQLVDLQARNNWNQNILMTDYEYTDEQVKLGQLTGNRFTITLRFVNKININQNWELARNLENLKNSGFINYFGLQRFGSNHTIKTHEVGKQILKRNWREVVRLILLSCCDNDPMIQDLVRVIFESGADELKQLYQAMPYKLRIERLLVEALIKQGSTNYLTAIQSLPRNAREIYAHAYQSYLWNRLATKRINDYGNSIVIGDLVGVDINEQHVNDSCEEQQPQDEDIQEEQQQPIKQEVILVTQENINKYNMSNVVIPLYGAKLDIPIQSISYQLLQDILKDEELSVIDFEEAQKKFFIDGAYRYLVTIPENVEHELVQYGDKFQDIVNAFGTALQSEGDYHGLILKFNLRKSSYATMLIREFTKSPSSIEYQNVMNDKYKSL